MDEESTRLRPEVAGEKPSVEISLLRTEIEATRDELDTYISELDRRRHEALDLKHQVRKHPILVVGAGVAIVGTVAGAVVMALRARRYEAARRKARREMKQIAAASPTVPRDPDWKLKLLLKAVPPIGIAVVARLLSQGASRRRPAA